MSKTPGQEADDFDVAPEGVTVKRLEDLEYFYHGAFGRLRSALGVRAFGMQVVKLRPNSDVYPEHDHAENGQEEVYIPLSGEAKLLVGTRQYTLKPGVFIRVGPAEIRKVVTGDSSIELLVVGGVSGCAYVPPPYTESGGALAVASASGTEVKANDVVMFDASESRPGAGADTLSYCWDYEGTGSFVGTSERAAHSYETPGTYVATLRVTDNAGRSDQGRVRIHVRP